MNNYYEVGTKVTITAKIIEVRLRENKVPHYILEPITFPAINLEVPHDAIKQEVK